MIDLGDDTTDNGVSKLVFTILSAAVKRDERARGRFLGGAVPWAHREPLTGRSRWTRTRRRC